MPSPSPTPTPTPQPLGAAPTGRTEAATVLRVVDGDTIEVDRGLGPEKVRYIGIDTPEAVHPSQPVEWMGKEASDENRSLVDGRDVVLEIDVSEADRYGRLLRYVWIEDGSGWLLVNLALVAKGYAQVSTYPPDVKYTDLYLEAQSAARAQGLGLWGEPPEPAATPAPPPQAVKPLPLKPQPAGQSCHPSYEGACLDPTAADYDCAGGSGNGPLYVAGPVRVVGPDVFDLDRDRDGLGCA